MAADLKSNLRKLLPHLKNSLVLSHVRNLASHMWASGHFDQSDSDEIKSCNTADAAVDELVSRVLARELSCIKGLADALVVYERKDLAEKVYPPAFVRSDTTGLSTTFGSSKSEAPGAPVPPAAAPAMTTQEIHDNLISASEEIAQRLTEGEVSSITRTLYASRYINIDEKEKLEDISRPTEKASALLGILDKKKDARAIQLFVDALRKLNRPELADMVQFGSTHGR